MKKFIILSVNNNPKYLFYVPLCVWAWKHFGWEPLVFFYGKPNTIPIELPFEYNLVNLDEIPGYHSDTITQVVRFYASWIALVEGYLMTGDIDMIPLSDYWKPDFNKLTVWGRDLSNHHYPVCYIGMPKIQWDSVMRMDPAFGFYETIQRDLKEFPQAKSTDKSKRWVTDQDLITKRINNSFYTPVLINRGIDKRTGYPLGRVDRSAWRLDHDVLIDCHLPHDILTNEASFHKVLDLLHVAFPKEDWKWFISYFKEFKKLI